ncbi:PaaI family thioesterase [Desulfonatronovibrio magnus]|uniref:PaaI family thioesterase n=1 Tax=Desulfonatronovibrio magnus TaxID=698827 RepID=UPI0005EBE2CA|nr:PaaI family thioesterase [Desulfonatronovibrio magnus]
MTTDNSSSKSLTFFLEEQIPFNKHLGIKVVAAENGFARLLLPFKPEFVGDPRRPALHGGILSTLIDTCGGTALWTRCRVNDAIATIDMRVDYLRPAPEADLIAESNVRLMGNRVGNVHTRVFIEEKPDQSIAEGRAVYNIRRKTS